MSHKPLFVGLVFALIAVGATGFWFLRSRSGGGVSAPPESETLLFVGSASAGELLVLRELLDAGINVNVALSSEDFQGGGMEAIEADAAAGTTALIAAAEKGQVKAVELLIAAGADPNLSMRDGRSPIHFAAVKCHIKALSRLIEAGARIDGQSVRGATPLHLASMACPKATRLLLEHGADPNVETVAGETPLVIAVNSWKDKIIKLLVASGAQVNHIGAKDGRTALHHACTSYSLDCATALIEAGADIEARTKDTEMTPLLLAAEEGIGGMVQFLIEAGADVGATDVLGRTALQIAEEHREETLRREAWRLIAKYLRELPATSDR